MTEYLDPPGVDLAQDVLVRTPEGEEITLLEWKDRHKFVERGGPGSGHHGHKGRPGEVGGSLPSDEGREILENRPEATGQCFECAAKWIMDDGQDVIDMGYDVRLVHGTVAGQGPLEGIRFTHAWVEFEDVVYDATKESLMKKERYYELGKIRDTVEYDPTEMRVQLLKHEHWGPWHEKFDDGPWVEKRAPLDIRWIEKGGPGSGHHGHRGRPGEVGGSLPRGGRRTYRGDIPSIQPLKKGLYSHLTWTQSGEKMEKIKELHLKRIGGGNKIHCGYEGINSVFCGARASSYVRSLGHAHSIDQFTCDKCITAIEKNKERGRLIEVQESDSSVVPESDLDDFIDLALTRNYDIFDIMRDSETWKNMRSEWLIYEQFYNHNMDRDEGTEWIDNLPTGDRTKVLDDIHQVHLNLLEGQDYEHAMSYVKNNLPKGYEEAIETWISQLTERGGPGSGYHAPHFGRPGKRGGSRPRHEGMGLTEEVVDDVKIYSSDPKAARIIKEALELMQTEIGITLPKMTVTDNNEWLAARERKYLNTYRDLVDERLEQYDTAMRNLMMDAPGEPEEINVLQHEMEDFHVGRWRYLSELSNQELLEELNFNVGGSYGKQKGLVWLNTETLASPGSKGFNYTLWHEIGHALNHQGEPYNFLEELGRGEWHHGVGWKRDRLGIPWKYADRIGPQGAYERRRAIGYERDKVPDEYFADLTAAYMGNALYGHGYKFGRRLGWRPLDTIERADVDRIVAHMRGEEPPEVPPLTERLLSGEGENVIVYYPQGDGTYEGLERTPEELENLSPHALRSDNIDDMMKMMGYPAFPMVLRGGPGSGHHGHKGRPGKVGGSLPKYGVGESVKFGQMKETGAVEYVPATITGISAKDEKLTYDLEVSPEDDIHGLGGGYWAYEEDLQPSDSKAPGPPATKPPEVASPSFATDDVVVEPEREPRHLAFEEDEDAAHEWAVENFPSHYEQEQFDALYLYKTTSYKPINEALRRNIHRTLDLYAEEIPLIDDAIAQNTVPDNIYAYRGMTFERPEEIGPHMVGQTFTDKGYVSTSLASRDGRRFANMKENSVLARIVVRAGQNALYMDFEQMAEEIRMVSNFGREEELLLPRGTTFKITDYKEGAEGQRPEILMEIVK